MKRRVISVLLVCLLLTSLLSVAAAGGTEPTVGGFQSVTVTSGYESKVTLTPLDAAGSAVTAQSGFYANAVKLKVDCTAADGAFYLIAALSKETNIPTAEDIQYIDQTVGVGGSASFTVYTKDLIIGQTYSIYLSSSSTDFTALTKVAEFTYAYGAAPAYVLGDVNGDDAINALDALDVLKHSVHKITLTDAQLYAGDVDHNNTVNALDALLILQYSVHKITEF